MDQPIEEALKKRKKIPRFLIRLSIFLAILLGLGGLAIVYQQLGILEAYFLIGFIVVYGSFGFFKTLCWNKIFGNESEENSGK